MKFHVKSTFVYSKTDHFYNIKEGHKGDGWMKPEKCVG